MLTHNVQRISHTRNSSGVAQERKIGISQEKLLESFRPHPPPKLLSSSGPSNEELKIWRQKKSENQTLDNKY